MIINKIDLGFGDERSFLKKEKIIKIYNKGDIITSRPKSSKNAYKVLSIKEYQSPKKVVKKSKENSIKKKKKKRDIEKEIEEEEDKRQNIGLILGKFIEDEEVQKIIDYSPKSIEKKMKLNKISEDKVNKRKNKSYIPNIKYDEETEVNAKYLQRTINIYKENEYLIKIKKYYIRKQILVNKILIE